MPSRGRRRRSDGGTSGADLTSKQLAEMAFDLAKVETRSSVAADLQESYFRQMEDELAKRQQELNRLKELLKHAGRESEHDVREAVTLAEEAVEAQEQKVTDYLDARPWLLEKLYNADSPAIDDEEVQEHLPEKDWRRRLVALMNDKEEEWREQLQREQDRRVKAWRAGEHARMQEQYEELQQALLERQERLEREWEQKLQGVEHSQLRAWMDEERQKLNQVLSTQMARLEQDALERERNWFKQLGADLERKEKELREQHKLELRLLEIEWREQEVLQRERSYLRKLEQEMMDEQREKLKRLTKELREELAESQKEQLADWLKHQSGSWEETRGLWHHELTKSNEYSMLQLTTTHQQHLDATGRELVDHFLQTLQRESEQIRSASAKEYGDWFQTQQAALQASMEIWNKGYLGMVETLKDEWRQCLAAEELLQREKWLAGFDDFTCELADVRDRTMQALLADLKDKTQLLLKGFKDDFSRDEAQRAETWTRESDSAIRDMQETWASTRESELQSWHELLKEQESRIKELEQLLEQTANQFTDSEAERAEKWAVRSEAAIGQFSKKTDEYLQSRTAEAISSLLDQLQQQFTSLSEDLRQRQEHQLDAIQVKVAGFDNLIGQRLAQAISGSEDKIEQLLGQWQHAMHAWKTETYEDSLLLLNDLKKVWEEKMQGHINQLGQQWQQHRLAEDDEQRKHWIALEQERQQRLDREQAAMVGTLRNALHERTEQLNRELQHIGSAADEQLKQFVAQLKQRFDSQVAEIQAVFSANEEQRERIWQLNSSAALDVLQRNVTQHLQDHSRANDDSAAKWRAEQAAEFLRLTAEMAKKQDEQNAAITERIDREMSASLQQIRLDAEQSWSGLFRAWTNKQAEDIELLGEEQKHLLADTAKHWMEEQRVLLGTVISEWHKVAAHSLQAQAKSWEASLADVQAAFEATKQELLGHLQQKTETEVDRWLGQQVTRVEQVLTELLQIHRDELTRREREWQELRNSEVLDLHRQGKEEIATLATQWEEMRQTAQLKFEQKWLDELRSKLQQVGSEWSLSLNEEREQLRRKLAVWQSETWQELQRQILSEVDVVEAELTDQQQQSLTNWKADLAHDLQHKWQGSVQQWEENYTSLKQQALSELLVKQNEMRAAFETQILKQLDEHAKSLSEALWHEQTERMDAVTQLLTEKQAEAVKQVDEWSREQHQLSVRELTQMLTEKQQEGYDSLSVLLQEQVADSLHRLEKEVDTVLQEQLEQAITEIASNINASLEELQSEMLERYLQELAQNEQNMRAEFRQHLESSAEGLRVHFRQVWQDQAAEYSKLHESDLAEQQGRALSRFEQSIAQECQKLREQYEELISQLREGIRSKQEAEMKALQEAAYREYRTRLDQIVGELTANHKTELAKIVQERDARLVAEIRGNLKAEIEKQMEEERQQRLAKAAQPNTPRRSRSTRR